MAARAGHLRFFFHFFALFKMFYHLNWPDPEYFFYSEIGLEVTFCTEQQNRKPQIPSSGRAGHLGFDVLQCS